MKIKELRNSDYKYTNNTMGIDYDGKIDFTNMIPELVELLKKYEIKDEDK